MAVLIVRNVDTLQHTATRQGLISRATPRLNDKQQMERVRWGCVSAYTTIKRNEIAFDRLIEAMTAGASVPECIQILEESPRPSEK
mmetsp:Transcript_7590/g.11158  ORF Transcript_7590/g.11158 Transcript_7590/m.11158 type:complete len:86 (+) Transcript_7590:79-336(+)